MGIDLSEENRLEDFRFESGIGSRVFATQVLGLASRGFLVVLTIRVCHDTDVSEGVPGGLVAREGGGGVEGGERGVGLGGAGLRHRGRGARFRGKVRGRGDGEGREAEFTKVGVEETFAGGDPLVSTED